MIGHDRRKKRWNGKKSGGRKWGDTSSTYEPDKDKVFTERQRGSVRREKKEEILGEDEEEARMYEGRKKKKRRKKEEMKRRGERVGW